MDVDREPSLVPYTRAVGMPEMLVKSDRDYGKTGFPCRAALLGEEEKNAFLRFLVPDSSFEHQGWSFKANILQKDDLIFSWNGFCGVPISEKALKFGFFLFDGSTLSRAPTKADFEHEAVKHGSSSWQTSLPTIIDLIEEQLTQ
jgi:hypothetical protein